MAPNEQKRPTAAEWNSWQLSIISSPVSHWPSQEKNKKNNKNGELPETASIFKIGFMVLQSQASIDQLHFLYSLVANNFYCQLPQLTRYDF